MVLEAPPVTGIWTLTRILAWALVGAVGGFLVGFLVSGYTCHDGVVYNCYPTQELKIGLLAAAGLVCRDPGAFRHTTDAIKASPN